MRSPDLPRGAARSPACAATLRYDDALAILIAHAAPLPPEAVDIVHAGGRILAAPLVARRDAPSCAVAAMDGYAVRSDDFASGTRQFRVCGLTVAGDDAAVMLRPGTARRVMTGAPVPPGGDTVLPWEMVTCSGDMIALDGAPPQRRHIRPRSSDFAEGTELLAAGARLGPGALALAAAGHHACLIVRPRPRVGIIASGNELVPPGAPIGASQCPDSLSLAIAQCVQDHHGVVTEHLLLRDDPVAIGQTARAMASASDVLVMIGGAAKGDRDFAKSGLAELGLDIAFANVAIKPGKPVWYGRIGGTHVLGLPGNPLAALTTARLFLVPLLATLAGDGALRGMGWRNVALVGPVGANGGRESFLCATTTPAGVSVVDRQQASGHLALAFTNALVRRAADAPPARPGDVVAVLSL